MARATALPDFGPVYTPRVVAAIAACSSAIARLDARFTVSPVASPWSRRATLSGYARALQLQAAEIDEIDLFAWGTGHQVPGRPARATHLDLFDRFPSWEKALASSDRLAWRDSLPVAIAEPAEGNDHPPLIRALEQVRRHARRDGTLVPWLGLPFALRDHGAANSALPALAGGAKAFRLKRRLDDADWLALVRGLEKAATVALERLHALERYYRDAQRAIVAEYRAGALTSLLALSCHRPLLSPQGVADLLGLSTAGASKLLSRAAAAGLLVEITQRRSWRLFLVPDLAEAFGYRVPRRGRPAKEPGPLPPTPDLTATFDAFDREMAEIDALLRVRAVAE